MSILIIFIVFVIFCVLMYKITTKKKNNLKARGYEIINFITYSCGHPNIDKTKKIDIGIKNKNIYILNANSLKEEILGEIDGDKIKNIIVEDETTFKEKVTLTRMALVGVFAFALKKRKKQELAYLTIEWTDGRFEHNTIFEYEKTNALQRANTDRNKIIKFLK